MTDVPAKSGIGSNSILIERVTHFRLRSSVMPQNVVCCFKVGVNGLDHFSGSITQYQPKVTFRAWRHSGGKRAVSADLLFSWQGSA